MIKRKSKHEYQVSLGIRAPYTPKDLQETLEWCKDTFGPGGRNKRYRWRYGWIDRYSDTFYFRRQSDAVLFVLRWS